MLVRPRSIVLLSGPEGSPQSEAIMRFRLSYEGPLRPSQRDPIRDAADPLSSHKQDIRKVFHGQLKRLWTVNRFLREQKLSSKFADCAPAHSR